MPKLTVINNNLLIKQFAVNAFPIQNPWEIKIRAIKLPVLPKEAEKALTDQDSALAQLISNIRDAKFNTQVNWGLKIKEIKNRDN